MMIYLLFLFLMKQDVLMHFSGGNGTALCGTKMLFYGS